MFAMNMARYNAIYASYSEYSFKVTTDAHELQSIHVRVRMCQMLSKWGRSFD